ncbi:MAG: bifunctional glutamate N-acetyltransferase/amino-acid acetyltransferase ArgJ [Oscillospiraceae bacterium]|nr:bifunctional glutamate N-acetyltransferase/amino-acid acetyltransferase ArgJ [Oscillospiraceae bacterium]
MKYPTTPIPGGVCAPKGFTASGVHCGIRKNKQKLDLCLIKSEVRAASAAVYTQNIVQGAPIAVTKANLADGYAQALICNSGNANTCNADGVEIAQAMCALVEQHAGIPVADVIIASTGVIGQPLPIAPIAEGMPALVSGLSGEISGNDNAAAAIMTTDLREKIRAFSFDIGGVECRIGGIAKGSGMINPNMATMLAFITTDVAITPEMLQLAISRDTEISFNMVCVDGDTSTNDMMSIMANGMAGNKLIDSEGDDFNAFCQALGMVTNYLAREIARDGEGATKLITCSVHGIPAVDARKIAKSVVSSSLVKSAMFGADANWGRILCAMGYSGVTFDPSKVSVKFSAASSPDDICEVTVCENGASVDFDEDLAKKVLTHESNEIAIIIKIGEGSGHATAWGCDLTYDYVKINGDYRT